MSTKKPYLVRVLSHITRLPDYISIMESRLQGLDTANVHLTKNLKSAVENIANLEYEADILRQKVALLESIDDRLVSIQSRISQVERISNGVRQPDQESSSPINNTVSDNHSFDHFYKKFEDVFRGSERLIEDRVSEHLPLFKRLSRSIYKKPIVDIGCGRGEFLRVLRKAKFNAVGVDMNEDMVAQANNQNLDAIQTDALSYLSKLENSSIASVTGFHIVEHIPFESLMRIFEECYRTIDRGGFVLFETPNPHSLTVGASTFYTDPSHIRPVPSELLSFMLEYYGFQTETIYLHRIEDELNSDIPGLNTVHESIFGYQDYAVIGRKP